MTDTTLRGSVAICGAATFGLGEAGGFDALEIQAIAATEALEDAGIDKSRVDGLFGCMQSEFLNTLAFSEYMGIAPKFSSNSRIGGSSFLAHVQEAIAAIDAGLCSVALITYGSVQRTAVGKLQTAVAAAWSPHETDYDPRFPVSSYALIAHRHMHEYGTTRKQMAQVAVSARQWAQKNPEAFERGDLTIEDVLSARNVSSPFGKFDCCLVTDGAGAIVLARTDIARDLRRPPVYVLGAGVAHHNKHISAMKSLTESSAGESAERAYAMAAMGPSDIQMLQVYDAFTINTILLLEDLGFVKKGDGGGFVAEGNIAPGGKLPVNTNGGGLSCCHPGMYGIFTLIEGTRQLRGDGGERQVEGIDTVLCHGIGGVFSSNATCILGTEATL